jgi:predicted metal-dependent enzyme (double-stranded beta helix superfamily)
MILTLEEITERCSKVCRETGSLLALYNTVEFTLNLNLKDYSHFIKYSDLSYQKNLMCSTDSIDVFLICWKAGQNSKIHDHPNKGCLMAVLKGSLEEHRYNRDKSTDVVAYASSNILLPNKISYNAGSDVLHQISPLEDTISVHIYEKNYVPKFYILTYTTSYVGPRQTFVK